MTPLKTKPVFWAALAFAYVQITFKGFSNFLGSEYIFHVLLPLPAYANITVQEGIKG